MEIQKVRTIFFGAGSFAQKILEGIMEFPFLDIVAVVTQPDKPAGRKQQLTPSAVKKLIASRPRWDLKVYQPVKLKEEAENILKQTKPEFILVADYSQMIPKSVIDYPKYKCLNVHGSLLPDLRGAVPATAAILKGYKVTGVSIPVMTPGLDAGDIVASCEIDILPDGTTYSLRMALAKIGLDLLKTTLPDWFAGKITAKAQDNSKATFTYEKDIAKDNARLGRDMGIEMADRMIRAYIPWPVAWVEVNINGKVKRVKILKAHIVKEIEASGIGFRKQNKQLYLSLSDGVMQIDQIQLEGKPVMFGRDALFLANMDLV
jgi:methionyl-tRNA formyltransferase